MTDLDALPSVLASAFANIMSPRTKTSSSISRMHDAFALAFVWWCIHNDGDRSIHAFHHLPSRAFSHRKRHPERISSISSDADAEDILPQLHTYQKPRQRRRSSARPRKPRFYWHSIDNLRNELCEFWEEMDVPIRKMCPNEPPPLPSEHLLNYFDRNDLRWGIAQMGGRENVAHLLGGARIVPGKWKEAVELEEVQCVLPLMEEDEKQRLEKKKDGRTDDTMMASFPLRASKNTTSSKEFWSKEKAVKELYKYLESYRTHKKRPAVWMPQLAELSHAGCSELFNACSRFQNLPCYTEFVHDSGREIYLTAGLVPFREWRFFESQLQLFVELQRYLDCYHEGSTEIFPEPSDVLSRGHTQLYELIRAHGGKMLLAQKLDMTFAWNSERTAKSSWGNFELTFAIQLLQLIRAQYMRANPPLSSPLISMPSEKDLKGHADLATQVVQYGGYENVARRLGLAYFDGKELQMDDDSYRSAKTLWKDRHTAATQKGKENERKRKGVAWDERLVVNELLAFTKANNTKRSLAPIVMPLFRHFDEDGRGDLKRAISKFGGKAHFCNQAGLIPIETWEELDEPAKIDLMCAEPPSH